jgi:hypothetical protein
VRFLQKNISNGLLGLIIFIPTVELIFFHSDMDSSFLKYIRDGLIIFLLLTLTIYIAANFKIPKIIITPFIFIGYILVLMFNNSLTMEVIAGARQLIMPMSLVIIGYYTRLAFQGRHWDDDIIKIYLYVSIVYLVLWLLPNGIQFGEIITNEYLASKWPLASQEQYVSVLNSASINDKFAFYRPIGDWIYHRYYGVSISPLTSAIVLFLIALISRKKWQKLFSILLIFLTTTRAAILLLPLLLIEKKSDLKRSIYYVLAIAIIAFLYITFSADNLEVSIFRHIEVYTDYFELGNLSMFGNGLDSSSTAARVGDYNKAVGESVYLVLVNSAGIIGVLIYFVFFYNSFKHLYRKNKIKGIVVIEFILVYGVTSESILGVSGTGLLWLYLGMQLKEIEN